MILVLDINVLLDVFQQRQPHYGASAAVLNLVVTGRFRGIFPSHGLTTLYYVVRKHGNRQDAEAAVDIVISSLDIVALEKPGWQRARTFAMSDFEDAVVAAIADSSQADYIVTRNEADFQGSPVPAISPSGLLSLLPATP